VKTRKNIRQTYQFVELEMRVDCSTACKHEAVEMIAEAAANDAQNMLGSRRLHTSDSDAETQCITKLSLATETHKSK